MTTNPLSAALQAFGATYTPAVVEKGQSYWRLIKADGPDFSTGNVVVFVDVLDAQGTRAVGVPVQFYWADGQVVQPTEAKPGDPRQGVSFVMGASGNAYGVTVADGSPSDSIDGMGLLAYELHASFFLVFQRSVALAETSPTTPPIAPGEPLTILQALDRAAHYINVARELL